MTTEDEQVTDERIDEDETGTDDELSAETGTGMRMDDRPEEPEDDPVPPEWSEEGGEA